MEKLESKCFTGFSESFLIYAKGDHLKNARFRNLDGEKNRILGEQLQREEIEIVLLKFNI